MAKKSRVAPSVPTRKQLSRRAKEERQKKMLYWSVAVLAVIIVAILAYGLYDVMVRQPQRPVALVGSQPIRNDYYQKMIEYRRLNLMQTVYQLQSQLQQIDRNDQDQEFIAQYYQQQLDGYYSQLEQAPSQVLEEVIDQELIRQGTEELGITVTDQEVEEEIQSIFGYDPNPPPPAPITTTLPITVTPTPTTAPMTEAEFKQQYDNYVNSLISAMPNSVGFTEQDFRSMIRRDLLRTKLEDYLAERLPKTAPQVKASHILLETMEDAERALERLKAGEDFALVAQEMSMDESNREAGGDLGWFPLGRMIPDFEKVAFNTPPGQISEIVPTDFGYHIIKVEDKDDNRELDDMALQEARWGLIEDWLQERRASTEIVRLTREAQATPFAG